MRTDHCKGVFPANSRTGGMTPAGRPVMESRATANNPQMRFVLFCIGNHFNLGVVFDDWLALRNGDLEPVEQDTFRVGDDQSVPGGEVEIFQADILDRSEEHT